MTPYRRLPWSGKTYHAIQVECGLCVSMVEPLHSHVKREMNDAGWHYSGKFGWLCPDCWPARDERTVIWEES